jgi:hypothetical protein
MDTRRRIIDMAEQIADWLLAAFSATGMTAAKQ